VGGRDSAELPRAMGGQGGGQRWKISTGCARYARPTTSRTAGRALGGGVRKDCYDGTRLMPVTAGEAMRGVHYIFRTRPCPECGSTIKGVPNDVSNNQL